MAATPANNDYPVLDGIAPSWADVSVKCSPAGAALIDLKDIKSINTGADVELGEQRVGGRLKKRSSGNGKTSASMTLYADGYQKLIRELSKIAKDRGIMRGNTALIRYVHFGVNIQYTPPGSVEIYEIRIKGACVIGRAANGSEGTDVNTVDVTLSTADIVDVIDGVEVSLI